MKMKTIKIYVALLLILFLIGCSNMDEWTPEFSSDVKHLVIESFENDFGKFTEYSVTGEQKWQHDRTYAIMTGYVSETKTYFPNEDWLISPEIDLANEKVANLSFEYVTRYFDDLASACTVWISSDYTDGNPNDATWAQLPINPFLDMGNWTFQSSGEISLTPYVGKAVHIAFKYLSTDNKAGTWEIKNIKVTNQEARVIVKDYGAGTEKDPFNVSGALQNQRSSGWVAGTIVGYIDTSKDPYTYVFGAENANQSTNILLADSLKNMYLSQTLPVQLPYGQIRRDLNLLNHADNLGKKVKLYGDLVSYFGVSGLKNVIYYEFEDGTSGGKKPFDPSNAIYFETFASNLGAFTSHSVSGNQAWNYNRQYKCAYMSGYVSGSSIANEDWLISPEIDLTGHADAALSFDHALRYNTNPAQDATVWISENYTTGTPADATWVQLSTQFKDGSTWDFVNIGDFSLSAFANKKIKIALVYKSTTARAGTWEVKNFIVK